MRAKKKMIRNIIIAVLVLGILSAGYYFAVKWEPKAKVVDTASTGTISDMISLFQAETDSVRSVMVSNPQQTYTLLQDDEGNISIPELSDIPFRQISLKSAFSGFLSISSDREITRDRNRAAEFGLDRKDTSLTITLKDGTKTVIWVGDTLPGENGRYCMIEDGDAIYTLSSSKADALLQSTNRYRDTDLFTIDTSAVTEAAVSRSGADFIRIRRSTEEDQPQNAYQPSWIMETPCPGEAAADDRVGELLANFSAVKISDFVDDHPTDLNQYGLGSDAYVLTVTAGEESHRLRIGAAAENGVYIQYGDTPFVYLGDRAYLDAVNNLDPMLYVQKFVHLAMIDNVASVTVWKDGVTCTLEIGDGTEEENPDKYKINGATVKADNFKKIYQQIIGILFVNTAEKPASGQPFMMVTYQYKDGHSDVSRYYNYDERYYLAERSSGQQFTVLKSTLNDLFATLDANASAQ